MAATTPMSFAEFERLEQGADKIELLRGELIRVPPAKKNHNHIVKKLFLLLHAAFEQLRSAGGTFSLGEVEMEMGYRFPGDPPSWLQPDVSVTYPNQASDEDYYIGAPLIAFEVVSESDRSPDLNTKVESYLANGEEEVWLIYPRDRQAWVYTSRGAQKETRAICSPLLSGVEIPLAAIL